MSKVFNGCFGEFAFRELTVPFVMCESSEDGVNVVFVELEDR